MTSPKCAIHEASLLTAVRSIFHVYLITKTCKPAAKTALLDMLRFVFSRMEAYSAGTAAIVATVTSSRTNTLKAEPKSLTESTSTSSLAAESFADCPATDETTTTTATTSEDDVSNLVVATPSTATATSSSVPSTIMDLTMPSLYHRDAYFVFRSLCKLSSKALPGEDGTSDKSSSTSSLFNMTNTNASPDPLALNNKILSLELILAVMDFCGKSFCQSESFIQLVQHHLCVSLLKNCVSNQTQVAYLSQTIFIRVVSSE
jgi:brefeldin A-inhibited guanine nucleotide-exchange protein